MEESKEALGSRRSFMSTLKNNAKSTVPVEDGFEMLLPLTGRYSPDLLDTSLYIYFLIRVVHNRAW